MIADPANIPCSDLHLAKIAEKIMNWEDLAPYFGISPEEEDEIRNDNPRQYRLQKRKMLWKWKAEVGKQSYLEQTQGMFLLFQQSRSRSSSWWACLQSLLPVSSLSYGHIQAVPRRLLHTFLPTSITEARMATAWQHQICPTKAHTKANEQSKWGSRRGSCSHWHHFNL